MKIKNSLGIILIFSLLILSGCQSTKYVCADGTIVSDSSQCVVCGNDICDTSEDYCSCPNDCEAGRIPKNCPYERPLLDPQTLCCVRGSTPG